MKYRIGWESSTGWKYITVKSHEEALEELADKICLSDKVSYRAIPDKKGGQKNEHP